jgi:hypothetical protein
MMPTVFLCRPHQRGWEQKKWMEIIMSKANQGLKDYIAKVKTSLATQ